MADPMLIRVEAIHRKVVDLLDQLADTAITEEELRKKYNILAELNRKLENEIHFYMKNTTQGISETKLTEYTTTQFRYEEWKSEADSLLKQNTPPTTTPTASAKLPKLNLPKFSGEILRWAEFWDRFKANIDDKELPEVEKLAYLVGCLEGDALQSVEGLSLTQLNYQVAKEILRDRYGDTRRVLDAHYEAITNMNRAGESAAECRHVLDSIERHLRILESLGENINGNHLRAITLSKFPEKVVYELHLLSCTDNIDKIRNGLRKIISAMEMAKGGPTQQPSTPTVPQTISTGALHLTDQRSFKNKRLINKDFIPLKKKFSRESFSRKSLSLKRKHCEDDTKKNKIPKLSCIFCDKSHFNAKCEEVKTVEDRKRQLEGRCYLCFKKGHPVAKCNSKKLCYYCQGRHNQALCSKMKEGNLSIMHHNRTNITRDIVTDHLTYLQTAVAEVGGEKSNNKKKCRLLLDGGSQRSYITAQLAKDLQLQSPREDRLMIFVFGSDNPTEMISKSTNIEVTTRRGIKRIIQVNIVPHITDRIIPSLQIDDVDIAADDGSAGENIQLLIGSDYYFTFFKNEVKLIRKNLYLVNTDFGWMTTGKEIEETTSDTLSFVTYCQCQEIEPSYQAPPDLPLQEPDLRFLWALENIGITDTPKATREEEAVKHFNETVKYENQRYQVKWPWIVYPPELPTNYGLAYGRLTSLVRRLEQDTMQEYDAILREQLATGIIEKIENDEIEDVPHPVHYLPHHIVIQKGKRGRIVYDASAKLKDSNSLNQCMYRGPSMLEDLVGLILKFRLNKIGITADVEKAFLQVGLQREDRDVTRFMWLKDVTQGVTEKNILHLRFCRVPFGVIASPFLLTATIRYHLSKGDKVLISEIAERTYVDNLVTSSDTVDEAQDLVSKARAVFEELSMNLREWISNDEQVMKNIPEQYRAKTTEHTKVLGLTWQTKKDSLRLKVNDALLGNRRYDRDNSKREVLRTLASLFDPCGLAAPLILPTKLLLQELWKRKLKWESKLPTDLEEDWKNALETLRMASKIDIPRYVGESPMAGINYTASQMPHKRPTQQ